MDWKTFINSPCLPLVVLLFQEFCAMTGLIKAMGVLFGDLSKSITMDSTDFGLIFSIFFGVGIFSNPIVSAVYSRIPRPRLFLVLGSTLGNVAILFASMATTTLHLNIAFAISGIGHNCVCVISCSALHQVAGDRFNLLYSISTCGYSFGIVLLPLMTEELLSPYGWRGAFLIIGGLFLNVLPCAMAIRTTPVALRSEDNALSESADEQFEEMDIEHDERHSGISAGLPSDTCHIHRSEAAIRTAHDDVIKDTYRIWLKEVHETHSGVSAGLPSDTSNIHLSEAATRTAHDDVIKDSDRIRLLDDHDHGTIEGDNLSCMDDQPVGTTFWNNLTNIKDEIPSLFRNSNFYTDPISTFIFLSDGVHYIIYAGWHIFLIPHATQRRISSHNIIIITFVAALGNFAIRPTIAFLTNGHVDPINMHLVLSIVNVCSLMCDAFVPSFYIMLVTSFLSATAIAGRAVICPLVLRGRVSSEHFQTAICVYYVLADVGILLGGYVSGLIADVFSSYDASFKLLAAIDVSTFVLMMVPKLVKKPDGP